MRKPHKPNPERFVNLMGALVCIGDIHKGMEDALMYEHKDKTTEQTQVNTQQAARTKRLRKQERNKQHGKF